MKEGRRRVNFLASTVTESLELCARTPISAAIVLAAAAAVGLSVVAAAAAA